jgi:histidinol-phosphate/aromatic aminotransferase/cobyric acid decarboxylase-like protein
LQSRYGGYWRYPKLLDFCYLVNPYFPPQKLVDEIKANFDTLLRDYPSGMRVNSLLAAKNFSVHQENILVGNGAAELIKSLMERINGKTGFVRPTFDEYPHRYDRAESVDFTPDNRDYNYSVDDLMDYFGDKEIKNLVVVNPDNPSGNYIPKKDLLRLIDWCVEKKINLILDESFADFSDEENNTLIDQEILDKYKNLYVMKSISKSYGVPGLRLGVLASGDIDTIAFMKKDVAIWNINSFAEFYMQIEEKYKKDYAAALVKFRAERARFQDELAKVPGVRVIPSQANFVMVELEKKISPKELLKKLLTKHSLLIKELTTKTNGRNYLRLAVRDKEDDDRLVAAMKEEVRNFL